jgi:peptidoglycan-associated lipoprotein
MQIRSAGQVLAILIVALALVAGACAKKKSPVLRPMPPPEPATQAPAATPPPPFTPPQPVAEQPVVPVPAVTGTAIDTKSLDELNRESPLKPIFFEYDAGDLSADAQQVLDADAAVLKQHPTWGVTIEGHCDERGTAEYNLALGERRAVAVRAYLVSLGVPADRLRTVSYGKEFPFDPGHTEAAWEKNRRAHFVITVK